MNLVEDFDVYRTTYASTAPSFGLDSGPDRVGSPGIGDDVVIVESPGASGNGYDVPLLSVDTTIRQAARGRGQVVCVCCCNEFVFVATSRGYLLRYLWDEYGNEKVTEMEVSKVADARITALFVDPTGRHAFITLRTAAGAETHYGHHRWTKSKALAKLKGTTVTAVGWCRPANIEDEKPATAAPGSELSPSGTCTGPVVLGTSAGVLLEVVVEERQKKEHSPKTLLDFRDKLQAPICAVFLEDVCSTSGSAAAAVAAAAASRRSGSSPGGALPAGGAAAARRVVVVATPSQLFLFEGSTDLETLFSRYSADPTGMGPALEAVSPSPASQLHLYSPSDSLPGTPIRFAWLVGSVVYHGELVLDPAATAAAGQVGQAGQSLAVASPSTNGRAGADGAAASGGGRASATAAAAAAATAAAAQHQQDDAAHLRNVSSLPLADSAGQSASDPRSLVMTEYHFLVLAADRLQAINRVSGRVVQEVGMKSPLTRNVSGETNHEIVGLVRDELGGKLFMHSDESLLEVSVRYEARDMWRVYLELQDWEQSLRLCSSPAQRDEVLRARADAALASGDYCTAAVHFAKIQGGKPAFEDVALQLIDAPGAPEPLQLFLSTRLASLSRSDRAQATMLAAWLTELYLDQINKALLEGGGKKTDKYLKCEEQLRALLRDQVEVLDLSTTLTLLATYGRLDDLLHYATTRGDNEAVLEYLVQRPGGAARALAVLRKPSVGQELVYKFAPALVAVAAEDTVDFFISARPALDPRRLIPALLRFSEPAALPAPRRAVLRYVEFAVDVLRATDSAVHNLAVALHALEDGEQSLSSYLKRARNPQGRPYFDAKYALRMATERRKPRACVKLLCELGMFEDAVQLALQQDLELAKEVASRPSEGEEALKRKLWLAVARHVVQARPTMDADQAASIKQAVEFLREAGGLLKIEDILPFFPDFVTIDNFKDAICDSLEHYNRQIEDLKREMAEATDIAEAVRGDLKLLSTRSATVSLAQPCTRCGLALADTPPHCGLPAGGAIPPFFLFPTGLAYHGVCCAAELLELVGPQQRNKVVGLMARLARVRPGQSVVPPSAPHGHEEALRAVQSAFTDEVAGEDPRNGEVAVRLVDMPFVNDRTDRDELASWLF